MATFQTSGARSALRVVSLARKWGKPVKPTGRRAIFGLCILCALAFSAITAQAASASGQTAFACVSTAKVLEFKTEHCVPGETSEHNFGHTAITEETHAKLSNAKTNATTTGPEPSILKETIAATNLELEATGAIEGLGTLKNEVTGTGEMQAFAESDENGITFNGVIVKAPAGKGCEVFEDKENKGTTKGTKEVVKTRRVKGHTTARTDKENGTGAEESRDSVLIEPATAGSTVFASFFIECTGNVPAALKGLWTVNGTLTCPTHGATIVCNHNTVTETEGLTGKGSRAGLAGKATITAKKLPFTEPEPPTHPISATTFGQEAFTCTESAAVKKFSSAHCVPGETGTAFGHVAITEETHTKISNQKTNAETNGPTNTILKETIAATNLELESTEPIEGLGTLKNEEVGGEKRATVTSDENGITYKGVIVKAPAGKGCKVFEDNGGVKGAEEVVKTKPVTGHTIVTGEVHEVVIEPVTPKVFATFFIECEKGKVPEALEGTWTIEGSIKCPTHGATVTCEHNAITTQNTLIGKGATAGLEGKTTITAGKFPVTEPTHSISVTTSSDQTAFACVSTAKVLEFKTEHCVPGETSEHKFGHESFTEETHAKFSNEKTNATTTGPEPTILKETIAATNLELEATGTIEGLGTLKNEEVGGEMQGFAESDANGITFNGVKVIAPAGKGCEVFEDKENKGTTKGTKEVVKTRPVKGHTTVRTDKENGTGTAEERHSVLIEPATAGSTVFATFFIECTGNVPAALKGLWTINGKLTCPTHGATIVCNHATVTETEALTGKGSTAGLTGKATITAGELPTEPPNPVSFTTTP